MAKFEKIIVVTKKTPLQELVDRFGTRDQARFYLRQSGADFSEYEDFDARYRSALEYLRKSIPEGVRSQFIDRGFLPTFLFDPRDLIVTLGPDGLVVNAAKYLSSQPILAFNPDPTTIDGVLVPYAASRAKFILQRATLTDIRVRQLVMAEAALQDGQTLLALNDLFVGQKTHVSARYHIKFRKEAEDHSSSGIIVSTGAGSTGWYRSIVTGAVGIGASFGSTLLKEPRFQWNAEQPELRFSVREPFVSKSSAAGIVSGRLGPKDTLEIVSRMPQNGVIFSDGVEEDFLQFNSGAIAHVRISQRRVHLIDDRTPKAPDGSKPPRIKR